MDKINVDMLTTNMNTGLENRSNNSSNNTNITVDNIINMSSGSKQNNFSIDYVIKMKKKKREKLLETYIRHYNDCLEKIMMTTSRDINDLIYQVPQNVADCCGYNPVDCLEFISNKLKQQYMDTYIINSISIFITWEYAEVNRDNKMKQQKYVR